MKRLLPFLLLLVLTMPCPAPIKDNGMTTNNPPQFQSILPAPGNTDQGKMVLHVDGKGDILQSASVVYSNGIFLLGEVTINNLTNVSTIIVTNITVNQDIHVTGKATFNQIILTNGFFAQTNVWGGPSNNVDISIYDQEYGSFTACQFSGIINSSNTLGGEVKLTIANLAGTNFAVTLAAGIVQAGGATSATITNGHRGVFWINHDPGLGGATNLVFQHF